MAILLLNIVKSIQFLQFVAMLVCLLCYKRIVANLYSVLPCNDNAMTSRTDY